MLIIGVHFFTWGSELTGEPLHCGVCGTIARFKLKRGMRFITLFFIIPVIPISGVSEIVECANCKTRFQSVPGRA